MRDNLVSRDDFADLSGVFKDTEYCPFIDSHHYSPYGNRLIAEGIAGHISRMIKE